MNSRFWYGGVSKLKVLLDERADDCFAKDYYEVCLDNFDYLDLSAFFTVFNFFGFSLLRLVWTDFINISNS